MPASNPSSPPQRPPSDGDFVAATRVVGLLTLVSRFAGLARDAATSRVFGASTAFSAFTFAFLIPNLFRRLFGEGALTAAFLPTYTRLLESDPATARRFARLVLLTTGIGLTVLTLLIEVALFMLWRAGPSPAPEVAAAVAGTAHDSTTLSEAPRALVLELLMIMIPYMPLICLTAVIGAMLQAHGRFAPTAAAPVLLSLGIIIPTVATAFAAREGLLTLERGLYFVGTGVIVSGVLQLGWSIWALRNIPPLAPGFAGGSHSNRHGTRIDNHPGGTGVPPVHGRDARATEQCGGSRHLESHPPAEPGAKGASPWPLLRRMWLLMLPMIVGLGVLQLNTLLDGLIASYPLLVGPTIFAFAYPLDTQSTAVIGFAQRLYQFPLGVFGIAIATAIFPALSRTANRLVTTQNPEPQTPNPDLFLHTLRRGLRLTVFIGLPASIGLMLVSVPLTATVYQGNNFTPDEVARVARVLFAYAPAVCAYSLIHILTRAFYAHDDARSPLLISTGMVGLNVALNLTLIWFLGEAGLGASTSICSILQVPLLALLLRRHAPGAFDASIWRSWGRIALTTLIMAIVVIVALAASRSVFGPAQLWREHVLHLLIAVLAGAAAYVVAARLSRLEEFDWLLRRNGTTDEHE